MKKKVKFLLCGVEESDLGPIKAINDIIPQIISSHVSLTFVIETDSVYGVLDEDLLFSENINQDIQTLINDFELNNCYKISNSGNKIWDSTNFPLPQTLEKKLLHNIQYQNFSEKEKEFFLETRSQLLADAPIRENLIELRKTIKKDNVYYVSPRGEEAHKDKLTEFIVKTTKAKTQAIQKFENIYFLSKAANIINKSLSQLRSHNNVIIWIGKYHDTKYMTTYIKFALEENKKSYQDFEIEIMPLKLSSDYAPRDFLGRVKLIEKEQEKHLDSDLKKIFKSISCQEIKFTENTVNGSFNAKNFDSIIESLKISRFIVPNCNEERKQVIKALPAKIISIRKDGAAVIEVNSSQLKGLNFKRIKFSRTALQSFAMTRKRVPLDENDPEGQIKYLGKTFPDIAIGYVIDTKKILLTYPKLIDSKVREIMQEWDTVKERNENTSIAVESVEDIKPSTPSNNKTVKHHKNSRSSRR